MTSRLALCLALAAAANPSAAAPLAPGGEARLTAERRQALGRVELAAGVWASGRMPFTAATGAVTQRAWRIPGGAHTPMQLLEPLRARLDAAGYETLFECADTACGGFDFRYAADLLPEPAMHVDLGDFHWLTAENPETEEIVGVMVSRSARAGFLHLTHIGPAEEGAQTVTLSSRNAPGAFLDTLVNQGRATLEDLTFATGAARLSGGDTASLEDLAAWLGANPGRRLRLVGHTDSQGRLDRNIALSQARASAVRDRLTGQFGIDPAQISVLGLGPNEPRATNDTAEGRRMNRRVEAVLD